MAEAGDVIERYESIVGEGVRKKNTVRSVETKEITGDRHTEGNFQELRDRIEKLESEKRNQDLRRRSTAGRCYICSSPEHFMRNCPNKQNQNWTKGNFQRNQGRRNNNKEGNQGNGTMLAH